MATDSDPTAYDPNNDRRRSDLANALAVMVSLPLFKNEELGRREGMSLGGVFATHGFGPGTPEGALAQEFFASMSEMVAGATSALVEAGGAANPVHRDYKTGPDAGSLPQIIYMTFQDARPWLESGALLWAVGDATIKILKGFDRLAERLQVTWGRQESSVIFTEPYLLGLCYKYVRDNYHPTASITMESQVRNYHPDYGSPRHPSGGEHYLIMASVGRKKYFFSVDANATIAEHFVLNGSTITLLPLPNWRGQEFVLGQEVESVRKIKVQRERD